MIFNKLSEMLTKNYFNLNGYIQPKSYSNLIFFYLFLENLILLFTAKT